MTTFVVTYAEIMCPNQGCGIVFFVPAAYEAKRRKDHVSFYCPNGHSMGFSAKSEEEKLRDQLAREKHLAEQAQARAEDMRRQRDVSERRRAAMKGQVTKIKNRVSKGVCPCCTRTFQNLQRHMASQHPDWKPEAELND